MVLTSKEIPGPGTYESLPAVNPVGKYPISKYNNSCATLFNPKNSRRFVKDFCILIIYTKQLIYKHLDLEHIHLIKQEFKKYEKINNLGW